MERNRGRRRITLFLCGDVMTGRGIDQILPHPSEPKLHENFMKSALGYVELAEAVHGPIPRQVDYRYIWGDALAELKQLQPDIKLINLETSITTDEHWLDKGINYRMHPGNIGCLTSAGIDCCALANNHILDWGPEGLLETLAVLKTAGMKTAGAGRDLVAAKAPAILDVPGKGRAIVFSFGMQNSGIPSDWAATGDRPGVDFLENLSARSVHALRERILEVKHPNDVVLASIHWGSNWGYEIPEAHREFAKALIDDAGVDIVHGHSSHHVKGIEVYRNKLILYGCGDFVNDYEGITGYEDFRGDLALMYIATTTPSTGELAALRMIPMQLKNFRINRACARDAQWLADVLNQQGTRLGTRFALQRRQIILL